ncbi:hypothetical protein L7F22_043718 [Adiantum nelumboides]|nr:hypothetical protein [Adiantum nelumboides]
MLRSSREGRKQAARFHANSNASSSSSSIGVSSFYNDRNTNTRNKINDDDGHESIDVTFVDSNGIENDQNAIDRSQRRKIAREDGMLRPRNNIAKHSNDKLQSNHFRSQTNSESLSKPSSSSNKSNWNESKGPSSIASTSEQHESSSTDLPTFNWTSTVTQWSRETSLDSLSSADTSSLSSPPSSRAPFDGKAIETGIPQSALEADVEMRESVQNSAYSKTAAWEDVSDTSSLTQLDSVDEDGSSLSSEEEEDDENDQRTFIQSGDERERQNSIPRFDSTNSILSRRSQRKVSKSLKQVEAEESQSLTPNTRRRSTLASNSSAISTPNHERSNEKVELNDKYDLDEEIASRSSTPTSVIQAKKVRDRQGDSTPASDMLQDKFSRAKGTSTKEFLLERTLSHEPVNEQVQSVPSSPSTKVSLRSAAGEKNSVPASVSSSAIDNLRKTLSKPYSESPVPSTSTRPGEQKDNKPAWKRKVFLTSGLYSNDHKVNESAKIPSRKSLHDSNHRLLQGTSRQRNTNHVSAFPLPTDFGYWVLTENKDFKLPYPISQEIDEIRLKMASKRKPPPYKHIPSNRYVSRPKLPGEIMICQCPPTGTCDETCVNRQTQYLCHPKHCPCGERCTNVQFGKRKSIKTDVHYYGARGFGLRTKEPIAKGQFIDEYRGEVVDYNEMVRRVRDHYKDTGNYYFLMYDAPAGEMLDGGLKGNITRYANHSCDPNCGIQKWLVCGTDEQRAGEFQVALFASRDIAAGEELTYDYGWSAFSPKTVTGEPGEACHCGAANCSGVMGVRKSATVSKSTVLNGNNNKDKQKKKKKKRRPLAKAAKNARNENPNVIQKLSNNVEEAKGKDETSIRKIKLPDALLSIIPEEYRTSNEIRIPKSLLDKVKGDLNADVSTPLGRKKWERAVASIIESHINQVKQDAQAQLHEIDNSLKRPAAEIIESNPLIQTKRIKTDNDDPSPSRATSTGEIMSKKEKSSSIKKKKKSIKTSMPQQLTKDVIQPPRLYVRDRVTLGLPSPKQLIDSQNIPILEGKRQRIISQRWNESQADAIERIKAEEEKAKKTQKTVSELMQDAADQSWLTVGDASSTTITTNAENTIANLEFSSEIPPDFPYDLSEYPKGTKFFLRSGEPYNFNILSVTRRGKKPRPYTQEELDEANERHRVNLKRLNDLRKFK